MGSAQPHLARGISRASNSTKGPRGTREMAEGWMRRSWAVATFQTHPTCPTAGPAAPALVEAIQPPALSLWWRPGEVVALLGQGLIVLDLSSAVMPENPSLEQEWRQQ